MEKPLLKNTAWWVLGAAILLTFFLYLPSLYGDFLDYDDTQNIVNNLQIRQLTFDKLGQFFTSSSLYMYSPITFISYALDYKIAGLNPFYFKLSNLLLHLINIILVFVFTSKLLKKRNIAIVLALLFALHPVNTDTVSWISARSNLLSALFFLLTLILYLQFLDKKKNVYLLLSVISFAFSLLSKSAAVMLPFVLLGIDYYQNRKINFKLIAEKIPFFVLSVLIGLIAVYFRTDTETTQSIAVYNLFERFLIICYSVIAYVWRVLFPFQLSEIYGYPIKTNGWLPAWYYVAPFIIMLIGFLVYKIRNMKREIVFGIFFFLVTVIITQITLLEDGFTANRYIYLPYIGFYFIIAFAYDHFSGLFQKGKVILIVAGLVFLSVLSVFTNQRSMVWMNTLSLFDHAIEQSPDAAFAYNSRGIAKYTRNDMEGALRDYNEAIKLNPAYSGAYYNRGIVYYAKQEFDKAINDYSKAIEFNKNFASAFCARGIVEMEYLKDYPLALNDYSNAIKVNPSFVQAYYNRGVLEIKMNDRTNACNDFQVVRNMGYPQADGMIGQYCR